MEYHSKQTYVNRTFKSTVFIMLFEDKKNLLELYNAMSGKSYKDPELLEISTLANAIYMSIKNDVSFIIDGRLSLYEHQSTYSPNLPLRFLFYVSHQYSGMTRNQNLYGTIPVKIPAPHFIIFYNGAEEMPERQVLRLSDLYCIEEDSHKLELEAVMLNIGGTNNRGLKESCRVLKEYAIYTDLIRKYIKDGMEIAEAVEMALEECVQNGVLTEFLSRHRAEAKAVSIFEYDQEKHLKMEREEAWARGKTEGIAEGIARGKAEGKVEGKAEGERHKLMELIQKKVAKGKTISQIAEDLEEDEVLIHELISRQ